MKITHLIRRRVTRYAKKQVRAGWPYQYGASGPHAFDCSGLFLAAWRFATHWRLIFPHNAEQISRDPHVRLMPATKANLRRLRLGDPIFYYGTEHPGHVAIYCGRSLSLRKHMIFQAGDPQVGLQKIAMRKYTDPSELGYVEH